MFIHLLIWVLGTWLIGTILINLAHRSGAGQLARQVNTTPQGQVLGEVAAFVFHIGIPFLAIIVGVLGLDLMALGRAQPTALLGFTPLNWVRGAGITIGTTLFVLMVLWLMSRGASPPLSAPPSWVDVLRQAAYAEVHWAFYRSVGALWFGDLYSGAVLGCVLIGLEWALRPGFRAQLQSAEMRAPLILQLITLIVSSALYLGVQNLWLMTAAHIVILWAGATFWAAAQPNRPASETPSAAQPFT